MPVIKSAIKKLRKDITRTKRNDELRKKVSLAISAAKKEKTAKAVSAAVSTVDRAVKNKIIHANKAGRMKSALSKLAKPLKNASTKPAAVKSTKAAPAKKAPKTPKK